MIAGGGAFKQTSVDPEMVAVGDAVIVNELLGTVVVPHSLVAVKEME
jgi:hypothetical protein